MADIERNIDNLPAIIERADKDFKGFTMDEIRYRRALVTIRKEYAKSKAMASFRKAQNHSPFSKDFGKRSGTMGKVGTIASKLLNGLNYLDYAMLGYTIFNSGRKIFGFFRKKK